MIPWAVGVGDLCLMTWEEVRSSSGVRGGGVTLSPSVFEDDGGDFLEGGGVCASFGARRDGRA